MAASDPVENRLLDAVLAAPGDDEPRLVYADWLMERGDPRGEFIAVQCTLARLTKEGRRASPPFRAALSRERVLEAENLKKWVDAFGVRKWWGEYQRGFIGVLTLSVNALRAKWHLFARLPLEHLRLQALTRNNAPLSPTLGDLAWLAAQPESERIAFVTIETRERAAVKLDWSIARPLLHGLSVDDTAIALPPTLALPIDPLQRAACSIHVPLTTPDHVADLNARCPTTLRSLSLGSMFRIEAPDMAVLVSTQELRGLEELSMWEVAEAVAAVAIENHPRSPPRFPNLTTLAVRSDRLADNFTGLLERALTTNKSLPTLTSLLLPLALDDGLTEVLEKRTAKLESLTLLGRSNDAAVVGFARATFLRRLRSLTLAGASSGFFGAPSVRPLLHSDFAALESLSLNGFLIGDANAETMKNTPSLSRIVELSLVACELNDARVRTIAGSPHLNALVRLNLQSNPAISPAAVAELRTRWPDAIITT